MEAKRKTTIQSRHISRPPYAYGYRYVLPEIRIAARWLEKAGFEIGKVAEIEVSENQLVIKVKSE